MNRRLYFPILMLATIIAGTPVQAQRDITGNEWAAMKPDRRLGFLSGFYAGMKADRAVFGELERAYDSSKPGISDPLITARYKADRKEYYSANIKYDFRTLAQLIDLFYTDPDNLPIPVPVAIRIIAVRDMGATQRADFLLMKSRREVHKGR